MCIFSNVFGASPCYTCEIDTWNQRWYRRANGLHISPLGINIEIRELHRFYKSTFPAIWRFALCPIRAMKIGRWTEQCHGWTSLRRVGNRENWWKPIAVSPSCSLGIKTPCFGNAKWRSSTACHAHVSSTTLRVIGAASMIGPFFGRNQWMHIMDCNLPLVKTLLNSLFLMY